MLRSFIVLSGCILASAASTHQSTHQSGNTPINDLTCDNGTVKLSINQLNDNYCDCLIDGSDERFTGACIKGKFLCINQHYQSINISSSFVNDGICDCCDGSDEPINQSINQSTEPLCPNTCYETGQKWLIDQSINLNLYEQGVEIRKSRTQSIKQSINQSTDQLMSSLPYYRDQLSTIEKQYDTLINQLNQLTNQQLQKGTTEQSINPSINQLHQRINHVQQQYSAYHREYQRVQGMLGIEEYVDTNQSINQRKVATQLIDNRWFSLIDRCVDSHTQQKRYDEHGIQIDQYLINLCLLKNITQIKVTDLYINQSINTSTDLTQLSRQLVDQSINQSINPPTTVLGYFEGVIRTNEMFQLQLKLEASQKRQSINQSTSKKDQSTDQSINQSFEVEQSQIQKKIDRLMGLANNGSYPYNNYRTGPPLFYLRYTGGEKCYGSQSINQSRNSLVIIECGLTDRLIDFQENGLCQYELKFQSPIACIPSYAKYWKKTLQSFKQKWTKHDEL